MLYQAQMSVCQVFQNLDALEMKKEEIQVRQPSVAWWQFLYVHLIASYSVLLLPFVLFDVPMWVFGMAFSLVWLLGLLFVRLRFKPRIENRSLRASLLRNGYIVLLFAGSALFLLILFTSTGWLALLSFILGIALFLPTALVKRERANVLN